MNSLLKVVDCIHKDLTPLSISREEFLALMVSQRIEEQSIKYDEEFDNLIKSVEASTFNSQELSDTLSSLKYFSETISILYSKLIKEIEFYCKSLNS